MTDTVVETQGARARMGLEPVRSITVVNPFHYGLAMVTGATIMYVLIAFGVANVPVGSYGIGTMAIVAAGLSLAFVGWFRIIRKSE